MRCMPQKLITGGLRQFPHALQVAQVRRRGILHSNIGSLVFTHPKTAAPRSKRPSGGSPHRRLARLAASATASRRRLGPTAPDRPAAAAQSARSGTPHPGRPCLPRGLGDDAVPTHACLAHGSSEVNEDPKQRKTTI